MFYIGCLSFVLFAAGDWNDVRFCSKPLKFCFAAGFALLTVSTVFLIAENSVFGLFSLSFRALFALFAAVFFVLLIHSLFFALPFGKTYVEPGAKNRVCDVGVYALCRHPGVLWFLFLYLCLWIAGGLPLYVALTFSTLNFLYAVLQDKFVFPVLLEGYNEYKAGTPFIIPSVRSLRRSLADFKKTEVGK